MGHRGTERVGVRRTARETRTAVSEIAPVAGRQVSTPAAGVANGHVACLDPGMWLTEELIEARRLQGARTEPRPVTGDADTHGDTSLAEEPRFELRYRSVSMHRPGYAFACDADGRVNLDLLSERARENYFYARAMVGLDLLQPEVVPTR